MGLEFILNILLGIIFSTIFYFLSIFAEDSIENFIKLISVDKQKAKKYVFITFFVLILFNVLSIVQYTDISSEKIEMTYLINFVINIKSDNIY